MPPNATGGAQGSISISTAQLVQARAAVNSFATGVNTTLTGIGKGTKAAEQSFASMGASIRSVGGALGVAFGAAGVMQLARFAGEADAIATTYRRQSVAALHLAGGQAKLNELMGAYEKATGGAVDRAAALAQVTRLMAVGMADSAGELTRIVTIARGASLAMGSSQDYILGQMQLAMSNQTLMRLDQIGVGVAEFQARLAKLRSENAGMTREMAFTPALLGLMEEKFGALAKSTDAQATGAEKAAKGWKDFKLAFGELTGGTVGGIMGGLATQLDDISKGFQDIKRDADRARIAKEQFFAEQGGGVSGGGSGGAGRDLNDWRKSFGKGDPFLDWLLRGADPISDFLNTHDFVFKSNTRSGTPFFENRPDPRIGSRGPNLASVSSAVASNRASVGRTFDTEQQAAAVEWAAGVQAIERDANAARLEATRTYEAQRASAIREYGLSIVREEQDFATARFRAAQNLARSIAKVGSDAAERDAEFAADSAKRIAEIRKDANERIAEQEADYAKNRVRASRDHRDKLLDAAARLDANAVFEEQKRFNRESQDAEEDHKATMAREAKQVAERIDQENEAHAERLEDARRADARRIEEMRESLAEAQRIEDEDRATRKDRQAEDHARQLSEMDAAHGERLAQINRQAAEERQAHNEAFQARMAELGVENEVYDKMIKAREKLAVDAAMRFLDAIEKRYKAALDASNREAASRAGGGALGPYRPEFQHGGFVPRTGPATLHAGEFVLPASLVAAAMRAPGGGAGSVSNSRSITVAPGAIVIQESRTPHDTALAVREELGRFLDEVRERAA